MNDYILAVSSTADLRREYLEEHGIPFISYTYTVGEEVFSDDCREETRQQLYADMRGGKRLHTSMINAHGYYEFLKPLCESGKPVLFLDMSREMSSSYRNSLMGADMVREEVPGCTLVVLDTRCISGGLGLLVKELVERKETGMDFDELVAFAEEEKLHIAHRFTVDDLNYLKAGGRVSNAAALVGSILSVKPVLYVPDGGTLDVVSKVRGRKAALAAITDGIRRDLSEIDCTGAEVDILHADCLSDAEKVRDELLSAFPQLGRVEISSLGVIIGAHCGPGLLTVFYRCAKRTP